MDDRLAILTPYQARWLDDRAEVKVCEKSRRIGLSWAEAADAAITAATAGHAGCDVSYVGYNREMAREFIDDCAFWTRRIHKAAAQIDEEVIQDEGRNILAYRIDFASGHKIQALSSRPSNLRGREGIAVIDEAAFHEDLGELLKAALAFLMWGGRVRVISTHDGADNPFAELVNDIRAGRAPYSLHRIDFDQACRDGLYRKICERQDITWSADAEAAWRTKILATYRDNADEELYCIPRAGGGTYLPGPLVESRMTDGIPVLRWEEPDTFTFRPEHVRMNAADAWCVDNLTSLLAALDPNLMTCFGEDFGRSGDLTVIWPLQLQRNLLRRTPFVVELRNIPFRQQEQVLLYICDRLPRLIAGALDARGNGQFIAESAAQHYGDRIEQVMLSVEWYRSNMPRYKAAFEDSDIVLPKDADILSDHRAFRLQRGVAQIPDKRDRGADGKPRHGDSAIAGALAWYASTLSAREYAYTPVPRRRAFEDGASREMLDRPDHGGDRDRAEFRFRANRGAW